ncbi:unnamed protein product, partial [marine sediment metagenome]
MSNGTWEGYDWAAAPGGGYEVTERGGLPFLYKGGERGGPVWKERFEEMLPPPFRLHPEKYTPRALGFLQYLLERTGGKWMTPGGLQTVEEWSKFLAMPQGS